MSGAGAPLLQVEGLLDAYTNLENPDFARVAQAIGFHAQRVERAEDLEDAVRDWIAAPGPALLEIGHGASPSGAERTSRRRSSPRLAWLRTVVAEQCRTSAIEASSYPS